jgi:serine/threonine protein kinase
MHLQNGRYEIVKILGQGGMGAAVLAHDTRIANKPVVIKELISDENDPQQRQEDVDNFKREVATLANLSHPLIPTVTDSFQEGSRYYMVQEYAPGENLETYLETHSQPMPEQEALTYISQVLDILDYLGKQTPPIIHRDIKPANIIISSKDKRARLVDFGIARADEAKHAAKRKQTSALGTPGYAPPEQYQGNADTRSDLYALAATLHHLVTHRDPQNEAPFSYPPARSLNPQVSPELERLLEHALMMDINKRYQSAEEMKQDVDEILQQRFHTAGDTSSYVLHPSRPITASIPKAPRVTPPPDSIAGTYGGGYQARPERTVPRNTGSARPTPPPFRETYEGEQEYSRPYGPYGGQQQQQMQRPPEPRYYAPPPFPMYGPQQNDNTNYVKVSFTILVIVVIAIALLLFLFAR